MTRKTNFLFGSLMLFLGLLLLPYIRSSARAIREVSRA